MEQNILATKFNTKTLLRYALPTILMMIFMSTYIVIDGLFVSNMVGEDALSAINIIMPPVNIMLAIGLMFATGGTAIMGRLMGEGRESEARSFLSVLYIVAIAIGVLLSVVFLSFPTEIVKLLGGKGDLFEYSRVYFITLSFFCTAYFLQVFVQSFFVLAGKPGLGFAVCFAGGMTNIILDYILISPNIANLGIVGAGIATGMGNLVPAVFGAVYFLANKKGTLYFEKPKFKPRRLGMCMFNGMSELVGQLSTAVTTLLFNVILLAIVGKEGVASISVILYIQVIQTALYFGYAMGVAPVISYKFGAGDSEGVKTVNKISFGFTAVASAVIIAVSLIFDDIAVGIFIKDTSHTFEMAKQGLRIFSMAYLFMGFNIYMSSMFTALSNGKVSAILSLARTLVFLVIALLALPYFFDVIGVWLAVPLAEGLAIILSVMFYKATGNR